MVDSSARGCSEIRFLCLGRIPTLDTIESVLFNQFEAVWVVQFGRDAPFWKFRKVASIDVDPRVRRVLGSII